MEKKDWRAQTQGTAGTGYLDGYLGREFAPNTDEMTVEEDYRAAYNRGVRDANIDRGRG